MVTFYDCVSMAGNWPHGEAAAIKDSLARLELKASGFSATESTGALHTTGARALPLPSREPHVTEGHSNN
jgi:hypothetical protein